MLDIFDVLLVLCIFLVVFVVRFCFNAALKTRHAQAAESALTRHKVTMQEMTRLWKVFDDLGIAESRTILHHAKSKSPPFSLSDESEPFQFVCNGGGRKENATEEGHDKTPCGVAKEMRSARISTLCTIKALNKTIKADLDAYRIANAERHVCRSFMYMRSYADAAKTSESSLADALENVYRANLERYVWAHRMLVSFSSSSSLDEKDDDETVEKYDDETVEKYAATN